MLQSQSQNSEDVDQIIAKVMSVVDEHRRSKAPSEFEQDRALRRQSSMAAALEMSEPPPKGKAPPGPPMPKGAPIRYRTPQFNRLVSLYVDRIFDARAQEPGRRGDAGVARLRENAIRLQASSRKARRAMLAGKIAIGDPGDPHAPPSEPLRRHQIKTLLDVQRYAMFEALVGVDGSTSLRTIRGKFRVRGAHGKRQGFHDTWRLSTVGWGSGANVKIEGGIQ